MKTVEVPIELFLAWMSRLANVPSQFGGAVYAGMEQLLAITVDTIAHDAASGLTNGRGA